jgi:hypothetical protein
MSNAASGYVAAHAMGHMFGLPDLHGAAALAPNNKPNLMCSGESVCSNSASIGSYLTPDQVEIAARGLIQWQPKKK